MVLGFCSAAGRQMTVQRRADDCIKEGRRLYRGGQTTVQLEKVTVQTKLCGR